MTPQGRYYSFDWGPAHFINVDTEWFLYDDPRSPAADGMLAWLENDLRNYNNNSDKEWLFVFQHKMPYTGSSVADQGIIDHLLPLYERYGVQIVIGGHWHNYQRYPELLGQTRTPVRAGYVSSWYRISATLLNVELPLFHFLNFDGFFG